MSADKDYIDIIRYLRGEMSHKEAHAFERRALDDTFLSDALEGAESIGADQFEKDMLDLESKLRQPKKSSFSFLKIAAVVSLLILGGFSVWHLTEDLKTSDVVFNETESDNLDPKQDSLQSANVLEEPKPESEHIPSSPKKEEKAETRELTERAATKPVAKVEVQDFEVVLDEEVVEEIVFDEEEVDAFSELETDDFADTPPAEETREEAAEPSTQTAFKKARRSQLNASGAVSRTATEESLTRELRGIVTDDFGDPLPGVNVVVKGTTNGVRTDMNGAFIINEVEDSTRLLFSSIGMTAQEIVIGRRDSLIVKMDEDTQALQEVVVTGYGAFDNEPEGYHGTSPVIGFSEFKDYLEQELIYPDKAKDKGIEGRVVLKVTISPIGKIDNIEVKRGLGYGCDQEAVRLIEDGPAWSPATKDGLNVEATVRIRVKFELE